MSTIFIAVAFAVVAAVILFVVSRRTPSASSGRLPGPIGLPLIGNIHQVDIKRYHHSIAAWADKYGPTFEFNLLGARCVALTDPEVAKKVLWARPHGFIRSRAVSRAFAAAGVFGVFSFEGEKWKRHRRMVSPAFSKIAISKMHHAVEIPVVRLSKKLQDSVDASPTKRFILQDPRSTMASFTLDVIMYLTMGYDLNSLENGAQAIEAALQTYFDHMATQALPSLTQKLREVFVPNWDKDVKEARKVVMAFIEELVASNRREVEDEQTGKIAATQSNLLKEMIRTREEDDAFTDEELKGEVLTIMGGGLDTTSILLSWALVMLSKYPQYHSYLRSEVLEIVGESATPSIDQTTKMTRINSFLLETLRFHGPVPILSVEAIEPFEVEGITYPPETRVFIMSQRTMENALNDPQNFRPERYDTPSDNPNEGFLHTLPFGGGPRVCPGRQLAMVEAATCLAVLVRSFDFELEGPEPEDLFNFTVGPTPFKVAIRHTHDSQAPLS